MRTEMSSTSPKSYTLSQTLAFYSLQCYTTRAPVRTALSPNEGLKRPKEVEDG